jgi:hypothetical protein
MCKNSKLKDLKKFYSLLQDLEKKFPKKTLGDAKIKDIPKKGIYFFFEDGQKRVETGEGDRVTRVGTHAIREDSKTTLWERLRCHRGNLNGANPNGGNHRGSIFRLLIGVSLIQKNSLNFSEWGIGNNASRKIKVSEYKLEQDVSRFIRSMRFLCLKVEDSINDMSDNELRDYIEKNSIGLLSNFNNNLKFDQAKEWLGSYCNGHNKVIKSGLWNQDHVDYNYNCSFLDIMDKLIKKM